MRNVDEAADEIGESKFDALPERVQRKGARASLTCSQRITPITAPSSVNVAWLNAISPLTPPPSGGRRRAYWRAR